MTKRLIFELKGKPENEMQIHVSDLARFLDAVSASINKIEADLGAAGSSTYRVSDLKFSSAVIEVEAVSRQEGRSRGAEVLTALSSAVSALERGKPGPAKLSSGTMRQVAELARPLNRSVAAVVVHLNGASTQVSVRAIEHAARLEIKPTAASGEETGFVDALNVHSELIFYLYPSGFSDRVACHFPSEMLEQVRAAVKRYATVAGRMLYSADGLFPTRIDVDGLEVHPPPSELPGLVPLIGSMPDLAILHGPDA